MSGSWHMTLSRHLPLLAQGRLDFSARGTCNCGVIIAVSSFLNPVGVYLLPHFSCSSFLSHSSQSICSSVSFLLNIPFFRSSGSKLPLMFSPFPTSVGALLSPPFSLHSLCLLLHPRPIVITASGSVSRLGLQTIPIVSCPYLDTCLRRVYTYYVTYSVLADQFFRQ
jgi:hypothetical protein